MFYKIIFISIFFLTPQIVCAVELDAAASMEASEFIKGINNKVKVGADSKGIEAMLEESEKRKENAKLYYQEDVKDIITKSRNVQNGDNYKNYSKWISDNKTELFSKQTQALSQIDYGISEDKKNKDEIANLLRKYRFKAEDIKKNQITNYPLMIFVSSSIPKSSLKDLMIQARLSGAAVVFRGLIGSLRNTQQFLMDVAKDDVSAIIDPRLFEVFDVKNVPTFVVLADNIQDCGQSDCNFTPLHDRISGNITLNYALEQIADGNGEAKEVAASILDQMKSKNKGGINAHH